MLAITFRFARRCAAGDPLDRFATAGDLASGRITFAFGECNSDAILGVVDPEDRVADLHPAYSIAHHFDVQPIANHEFIELAIDARVNETSDVVSMLG